MTTPFRNDLETLQHKKAALESELAAVNERIEARKRLPMLDQVRVASPCNASWDEMLGDDRVRFCTSCEKNVFNLSAMSREDAERLIQERLGGGELCVRFYQRADGTVMTQDCPVGVTKKRRKMAVMAAAGAGAMALAATSLFTRTMGKPVMGATMGEMTVDPAPHVMGSVAAPVDTVPPVQPESETPHVVKPPPPPAPPVRMGRMVRTK